MLPADYFLVRNWLLYYHCDSCGKPCELLVMPHLKIDTVMHLAHIHLLGGHLGPQNVLEKNLRLVPLAGHGG